LTAAPKRSMAAIMSPRVASRRESTLKPAWVSSAPTALASLAGLTSGASR
jgi:hypothetical protein